MTGGKVHQPPLHGTPSSKHAHFDPLQQYISAKEVAHKRLGHTTGDVLKRSNSSGTCNADERRVDTPTVTMDSNGGATAIGLGTSQSAANSPRGGSGLSLTGSSSTLSDRSSIGGTTSTTAAGASPGAPGQEYILKVVLIGDSGVGKSNLVMRFTKNKYQPKSVQTVGTFAVCAQSLCDISRLTQIVLFVSCVLLSIGFEFATKMIRVGDRRIKAQIWDTAGQERFQSLTAAYYRNAVGAMIVYDITNRSSFEHVTNWLTQVHAHAHESLVLILVGNKCDLAHLPQSRQVSTLEAARFAAAHSMEFVEASALDATNVVDAFKKLIVPVGRLLSPTHPQAANIARLPPGWRRVLSRTRYDLSCVSSCTMYVCLKRASRVRRHSL